MAEPSIWSYQDNFDFRKDVDASSPFHHPLEHHRGEYSRQRMLTAFHLDPAGQVRPGAKPKLMEAVLFGGHVGCGKSTELRDYAVLFRNAYTVHQLELTKTLDINNLRFSDLLSRHFFFYDFAALCRVWIAVIGRETEPFLKPTLWVSINILIFFGLSSPNRPEGSPPAAPAATPAARDNCKKSRR